MFQWRCYRLQVVSLYTHSECSRGSCVCNADLEMAAADGATDDSEDEEVYEVRVAEVPLSYVQSFGAGCNALALWQQVCNGMMKHGDARWTVLLCLAHAPAHVGDTQQPVVVTTGCRASLEWLKHSHAP
jgi:hypothetical protein